MQALLNGLDGLLGVHCGRARNDDGLQRRLLAKHLIVVQVRPQRTELCDGGIELGLHRRADGDEVGLGCQGRKVSGVSQSC